MVHLRFSSIDSNACHDVRTNGLAITKRFHRPNNVSSMIYTTQYEQHIPQNWRRHAHNITITASFLSLLFTCVSVSMRLVATSNRFGRDKYLFCLKWFSNSKSCCDVKAVRGRRVLPGGSSPWPDREDGRKWQSQKRGKPVRKSEIGEKKMISTIEHNIKIIGMAVILPFY